MKVLIIGGVAGGATTATRLRRLNENIEIIIIERGEYVSFANCGLPYYIGNVIENKENLLLQTPVSFKERFNIDVRIKEEAIEINRESKEVAIKRLGTGEIYKEKYDKLVLSPGAKPINPFENLKSDRIQTLRTINDSIKIKENIMKEKPKNVAIIGGGYIGVEMAENLRQYKDINISIIEKSSHLIGPIDTDIAQMVNNQLQKNGINIILNNGVKEIEKLEKGFNIKLEKGKINSEYIILCIGVRPESDLAIKSGLKVNDKGAVIVNEKMETNDKDIYALGDCIQVTNFVTKKQAYIPLAGPANKQARIVANNICFKESTFDGSIGSSILKVFDKNLGITGINEKVCVENNIDYKSIIVSPYSHATYYPNATQLVIKAIYRPNDGKILGAQVWGKEGVDKITDILATSIRMNMKAKDLSELELCYAPPFSSAKSPINILGNAIENELDKLVENISVEDLLKKKNPYILDVRTVEEYNLGHMKNAINIPLDKLRENLGKISNEKEINVYCKTGLRSYIACRILNQNGFNTKNITGGYDLIKLYK